MHSRTQIRLETLSEVTNFVKAINGTGTVDKYVIENFDCSYRVDARSYLGVMYASSEFGNSGMFLVNLTNDGDIPSFVDNYRKI